MNYGLCYNWGRWRVGRSAACFIYYYFFFCAPFCTCPMLSSGSRRLTAALRAARPREGPPRRGRRPAGSATPGALARAPAWLRAPRGLSTFGLALDLQLPGPTGPLSSASPREPSEQRQRSAAEPSPVFEAKHHEAAASTAAWLQFGVSAALARGCLCQRQPGPRVGTWPGLPVALQGAHECRVDRDLRSLPQGQAVSDYLDPAAICGRDVKV